MVKDLKKADCRNTFVLLSFSAIEEDVADVFKWQINFLIESHLVQKYHTFFPA